MRKDRVRSIIIIVRYLPIQEQIIKLNNAQKNFYIDEEEIDYIKNYLNIKEIAEEENVRTEIDEAQTMTEMQIEQESTILTTEATVHETVDQKEEVTTSEQENQEQVILVDTRIIDATKNYIKSKSFEGRLEKIAEEAKSIEILGEEDYTLEEAKKLKTQLVGLRASVIALHSDVQLLHDGGKEKTTERMRASTETLDIIEEKIKKMSFYILEKTPKIEEFENEELTPWNKVKKFFGNIRKKFISTESESPRKVQKRFNRIQEKLEEILESESRQIESLVRDVFFWTDTRTEQNRIDTVYRMMCGKPYICNILEGPEEEKNEVIRLLYLEMKNRHQEWLKSPRNPINMGQKVCEIERAPENSRRKEESR